FKVKYAVAEEPGTWVERTVLVSNATPPWITVPPVRDVALNASFDEQSYMAGVNYGDNEDAHTKLVVVHDSPVDTAKAGLVKVSYSVTDSDHNSATATGIVIVNNGTWAPGSDWAVAAYDFVTTPSVIAAAANTADLILSLSHAEAFMATGGTVQPVPPLLKADGGLTAMSGTYNGIQVGVAAAAAPLRTIKAIVVDKGVISNDPAAPGGGNDLNTSDPADAAHYIIAANDVVLTWDEAGQVAGQTDAASAAKLVAWATAEAFKVTPAGVQPNFPVAVLANGIQQASGCYDVTFIPIGVGGVAVTVKFRVDQGTMPVISISGPLIIDKASATSGMTRSELLQGVNVSDADDPSIGVDDAAITLKDANGLSIAVIDKSKPGVYQATYTVKDPVIKDANGNPAASEASRAIVINDGRFLIDLDQQVIVGAKSFVVSAENPAFAGTAADALNLSCAEAYDFNAAPIVAVLVDPLSGQPASVPLGFAAKQPAAYPLSIGVQGYPAAQRAAVVGSIVADDDPDDGLDNIVIDAGPDPYDSPYAVYAKNFSRDVAAAAAIAGNDAALAAAADAHVLNLLPTAPSANVAVVANASFAAAKGIYAPVIFGIQGQGSKYAAAITAIVSDASGPQISASAPYQVVLGSNWSRSTAMVGVSAHDPGDGDLTNSVVYYPTNPAKPVDTNKPGVYQLTYQVSDSDGNTATTERAVVVNDGRYQVGQGRILEASPFVIKLADVPVDASILKTHLVGQAAAHAYNGKTGIELSPSAINVDSTGGYGRLAGSYDVTFSVADLPSGRLTKTVKAQVVAAEVDASQAVDPNDPSGQQVYVYGNNAQLRISEAARILSATDPDAALLAVLGAGAFLVEAAGPTGTIITQAVKIVDKGGLTATPGIYYLRIADLNGICTITLSIKVLNNSAPIITPECPVLLALSTNPHGLTPSQMKGKATAADVEDGDLTAKIQATGNVPANIPGIYPVTLTVTDSDGQTATQKTVVVIDDGNFAYGQNYILHAVGFSIAASAVSTTASSAQVISRSGAYATAYDGTPTAVVVSDLGGYTNARGSYAPTVVVAAQPTSAKRLSVTVTAPQPRYCLSFDANGGTLTGPSRIYVQEPATTLAYLPSTPLRPGYSFSGWFTARSGGSQFTADTPVTANHTVYAHWQKNPGPPAMPIVNNYYTTQKTYKTYNQPPTKATVKDGDSGDSGDGGKGGKGGGSPTYVTANSPGTLTRDDQGAVTNRIVDQQASLNAAPAPLPRQWSLFNLCVAILSLILLAALAIKYPIDRRGMKEYQEKPIDQEQWLKMTREQRAAFAACLEHDRRAFKAEQQEKINRPRVVYVNAPVLLIAVAIFVEIVVVILATQDFTSQKVIFDQYSITLSLAVFLQLLVPMVSAVLHRWQGMATPPEPPRPTV
ncbi:MAG: DUF5011 domain-containing protein, partial [Actinomycetia bacterium]|nr:DUF5011 domain-containing protein [Actinomycetes bacterium]